MKRTLCFGLLFILFASFLAAATVKEAPKEAVMWEDMWGNNMIPDFSKRILIEPFSTSNCGYCLIDGDFFRINVADNALRNNDTFYKMCLANPQRDILAYLKHFRMDESNIIAYPSELWAKYHQDGYPHLTMIHGDTLRLDVWKGSYDRLWKDLREGIWKNLDTPMFVPGTIRFASSYCHESTRLRTVLVFPDSLSMTTARTAYVKRMRELNQEVPSSINWKLYSEIKPYDWNSNLYLNNPSPADLMDLLRTWKIPVKIDENTIGVGKYRFASDSLSYSFTCPNPKAAGSVIVVNHLRKNAPDDIYVEAVDYYFEDMHQPKRGAHNIIYGMFAKSGNLWAYSDSLVYGYDRADMCVDHCPVPMALPEKGAEALPIKSFASLESTGYRIPGCRFPDVAAWDNTTYTVFEKQGDIYLAVLADDGSPRIEGVELTSEDAYDARIAVTKDLVWVFYVRKNTGFYRLFAKFRSMGKWSGEIQISLNEPFDSMTPAVAALDNKVSVYWSVWKANQQFLYRRLITDDELGAIEKQKIVYAPNEDYNKAWTPAVCFDTNGNEWKAWSQHYPVTMCTVAGMNDLEPEVISSRNQDDLQGYPSITCDRNGAPCVAFVDMDDMYSTTPRQKVMLNLYNKEKLKWGTPISLVDQKDLIAENPVPVVAKNGMLWVFWAQREVGKKWQIMGTALQNKKWSDPIPITSGRYHARNPRVCAKGNGLMITYQALDLGKSNTEIVTLDSNWMNKVLNLVKSPEPEKEKATKPNPNQVKLFD